MTLISKNSKSLTSNLSNRENFHPREVVYRVSETQLQVGENSSQIIWWLMVKTRLVGHGLNTKISTGTSQQQGRNGSKCSINVWTRLWRRPNINPALNRDMLCIDLYNSRLILSTPDIKIPYCLSWIHLDLVLGANQEWCEWGQNKNCGKSKLNSTGYMKITLFLTNTRFGWVKCTNKAFKYMYTCTVINIAPNCNHYTAHTLL